MMKFEYTSQNSSDDKIVEIRSTEYTSNRVNIYKIGETNVYGVNFSALGTVTIEEAKNYVRLIKEGINICESYNKESQ